MTTTNQLAKISMELYLAVYQKQITITSNQLANISSHGALFSSLPEIKHDYIESVAMPQVMELYSCSLLE
jgi:hypothetical protein